MPNHKNVLVHVRKKTTNGNIAINVLHFHQILTIPKSMLCMTSPFRPFNILSIVLNSIKFDVIFQILHLLYRLFTNVHFD